MAEEKLDDTIVRALGESENRVFEFQRSQNYTMVDSLALTTQRPISTDLMSTALHILRTNFPTLRLRISDIDGRRYFKYMEDEAIDFDCIQGDWREHYERLMSEPFNDEVGPLWRARLMPIDASAGSASDAHKYELLLSWNHTITDGLSNVIFTNRLMEIISTLLGEGNPKKDVISEVPASLEDLLQKKDFLWSEIKDDMKGYIKSKKAAFSTILDVRQQNVNQPRTRFLQLAKFEESFSKSLVQRCKKEGTTVHGALTAAIHEAVFRTLKQKTGKQGPLTVLSHHAVNMRRFLGNEFSEILGFMVVLYPCLFVVPEPESLDFWQRAQSSTAELRRLMGGDNLAKRILTMDQLADTATFVEDMKKNPRCVYDYTTSNMMDITGRMPGVYPHLTVDAICRSLAFWADGAPYFFNLTTFRGNMYLSLSWHTNFFDEEEAKAFGEMVVSALENAMS